LAGEEAAGVNPFEIPARPPEVPRRAQSVPGDVGYSADEGVRRLV
jgi:hypothetical protein